MAGDWIKVEKATARKREILVIAGELGIHPDQAFGLCFRFWSWCDENMSTCHAPNVTLSLISQLLGHDGFAAALVNVGWLNEVDGSIEIPNFERHLSQSAKNRALATERKRESRKKVTPKSQACHDDSVTETGLEKRREEKTLSTDVDSEGEIPPLTHEPAEVIGKEVFADDYEPISLDAAQGLRGMCGISDPAIVESWHVNRSADGWKRPKGGPITSGNWRHDLKAFALSWGQCVADRAASNPKGNSGSNSGTPASNETPREAWKVEQDIKRLQKLRADINNDHRSFVPHPTEPGQKQLTPDNREKLKTLREKIAALKTELINAA